MAILTVNWPNLPKDKDVTVPGISGRLQNGHKYDVGDQLDDDLVLGEPLHGNTAVSELITHVEYTDEGSVGKTEAPEPPSTGTTELTNSLTSNTDTEGGN